MNALRLAALLALLPASASAGLTSYNASLDEYVEYQPSMIVALHHGRQALIEPDEMSFTPKLWFGGANPSSGAIEAGFGFAYEGSINPRTGFGIAIGAYDGTGESAGIAASLRRNASPGRRVNVTLQAVLGYQWSMGGDEAVVQVPDEFGDLTRGFLVRSASWTTMYVHAVADHRLGPLRPVVELGALFARSSVRGSPETGPFLFQLDRVDVESMLRLTGGGGLALDLGSLEAYMGAMGYDGGQAFMMSLTITAR